MVLRISRAASLRQLCGHSRWPALTAACYIGWMQENIQWELLAFSDLGVEKLYRILQARAEVFIVEQRCAYLDIDDLDPKALHLIGWSGSQCVAAYLRLIPPGEVYEEPAFGRVLTTANYRGIGLGRKLMQLAIQYGRERYPERDVRISAQRYLEKFYRDFGFNIASEPYDEDGIPHIEMLLQP